MKLIIDIDDKRIKGIKLIAKEQDIETPYPTLEQIIANGIPLDKWIPVSERLPNDEDDVLFCDLFGHIRLGYHPGDWKSTHFAERGSWELQKNVAAWMPLPKPYKAESEEV